AEEDHTMHIQKMTARLIALAALAGCGGYNASAPDGGGVVSGGPAGAVTLGSGIQFVSRHNGSQNPAVDTIEVGDSVTWSWTGSLPHSVQSIGPRTFSSSDIKTGSGTYAVTFTNPGTYQYDCAVHGKSMTGTVVVR